MIRPRAGSFRSVKPPSRGRGSYKAPRQPPVRYNLQTKSHLAKQGGGGHQMAGYIRQSNLFETVSPGKMSPTKEMGHGMESPSHRDGLTAYIHREMEMDLAGRGVGVSPRRLQMRQPSFDNVY